MGKKGSYIKKAIKTARDLMNPPKVKTTGRDKQIRRAVAAATGQKKSGKDEGWNW